jgi:hypothetical protein
MPTGDSQIRIQRGDYLVYPVDRATYAPVVLLRYWLLEEFARES